MRVAKIEEQHKELQRKNAALVLENGQLRDKLAEAHDVEMPIANDVYQVVSGQSSPRRIFRGLLKVSAGAESDPG